MALSLPNGATVHIGSELDAAKKITAATNAAECVITAAAHGLANGDYVVLTSGWADLDNRVFKVANVDAATFRLVGANTTDTDRYPAGGGVGEVKKVKTWTRMAQILDFATTGGEQQYWAYGFLEDDFDRQMPTTKSAMSINIGVADDKTLPGYQAAVAADESGVEVPLRINLKKGDVIVYNGFMSVNQTPTMTRNEGMKINMSYSLAAKVNRY